MAAQASAEHQSEEAEVPPTPFSQSGRLLRAFCTRVVRRASVASLMVTCLSPVIASRVSRGLPGGSSPSSGVTKGVASAQGAAGLCWP